MSKKRSKPDLNLRKSAPEPSAPAQAPVVEARASAEAAPVETVAAEAPPQEAAARVSAAPVAPPEVRALPAVQTMPALSDAPSIASPRSIAAVVSSGIKAFMLLPSDEPTMPLVQNAPAAFVPPTIYQPPVVSEPAAMQGVADPTPRAYAPTAEEAGSWAPRPAAAPVAGAGRASWVPVLLAGALVMAGAGLLGKRVVSGPQVAERSSKPAPAPASRLLASGVDNKVRAWLDAGEYVVAAADQDGHMSTSLILDELRSKDPGIALKLARHKSAMLERPLFIIAKAGNESEPKVIERVNPSDEQAYRDYMMSVWYCKQGALAQSPSRYVGRNALHPEQTLRLMTAFVQQHSDSRLVDEALKDMRFVCYYMLQDPVKFRNVTQQLVDQSFLDAKLSSKYTAGPELARVAAPFLKENINQVLYQRVYRLRSNGLAADVLRQQD